MGNRLDEDSISALVVMYIRVSTSRQAEEGDSIENQQRAAEKWAKSRGHTIIKTYIEEGSSAFNDKRTVFPRMIDDILTGRVQCDYILVYHSSRFYRVNHVREDIENKLLSTCGLRVRSITEPVSEDDDMEFMQRNFVGVFNEYQSRQNSRQVTDAMNGAARQGFFADPGHHTAIRVLEQISPPGAASKKG